MIAAVPAAADTLAVRVNTLPASEAVTPGGKPAVLKTTAPLNPFSLVIAMVDVAELPGRSERLAGEALRLNYGAAATVKASVALLDTLPEVPVRVTVEDPATAEALAVKFSELPALSETVTPAGKPDTPSVMVPEKPFCGMSPITVAALASGATVRDAGESVIVNAAAAVTVRLRVAVLVRLPDVPVMVTIDVPAPAEPLALSVIASSLKAAVTPDGNPDAENATAPLNPFCTVTPIAAVALPPCGRLTVAGENPSVKPPGAVTVRVKERLLVKLPAVPVRVSFVELAIAEPAAVKVSVLDPVVLAGLKLPVTPEGNPDTLSATLPEKPVPGTTAIPTLPLAPCVTETVVCAAERENEAGVAAFVS